MKKTRVDRGGVAAAQTNGKPPTTGFHQPPPEALVALAKGYLMLIARHEANKGEAFRTPAITAATVKQLERVRDQSGSAADIEALRMIVREMVEHPRAYDALYKGITVAMPR